MTKKLKIAYTYIYREKWFSLLALFFFVLYAVWSVYRHNSFQTDAIDLGIFDQAVWKYSVFKIPFNSIKFNTDPGINLLADHFHPILIILAPLFWLWSDARVILIVQALLVAIGAVPVYLLALKRFHHRFFAWGLSFSYLAFLGVQTLIDYDFHELAFALPLLSWAIYWLLTNHFRWYFGAILLLFLVKEDMPLYTAALGLYALFHRKLWRVGLATIIASALVYYLVTRLAIPSFYLNHWETTFLNPSLDNPYFSYEKLDPRLGVTTTDLLKSMITQPGTVISVAFDLNCLDLTKSALGINGDTCVKLRTILNLLGSFGFLPLLGFLTLVLTLPNIISRFVTTLSQRWIVRYQYSAILAPIFALATIDGVSNVLWLKKKMKLKIKDSYLLMFFGVILIISPLYFSYRNQAPLMRMLNPSSYRSDERFTRNQELLAKIPPAASVIAQTAFVPHLSHRDVIYRYYAGVLDTTKADYVVVSTEEHSDPPYLKEDLIKQINEIHSNPDYEEVSWDGYRLLLKRKN